VDTAVNCTMPASSKIWKIFMTGDSLGFIYCLFHLRRAMTKRFGATVTRGFSFTKHIDVEGYVWIE